jgi:hypothetical protein
MSLDAASYPLLWGFADSTGVRPEWVLPVLHHESGFNPALPNSAGYPYYGLNQVSGGYLTSRGVAPADYLTWPASKQLQQVVLPFLHAYAGVRSATRLYQANFLPATLKTATSLSDVISRKGDPYYGPNASLDANHDGVITVGDLAAVLEKDVASPAVQQAIAAAYLVRPDESPKDPVYGEDFMQPATKTWLIALGIAAVAGVGVYGIEAGWFDALLLRRRRRLTR